MNLQLLGCSHHRSSLTIRERIAINQQHVSETLTRFQRQFPKSEAVVLSTCNRTEIYTASVDPGNVPSPEEIAEFLATPSGLDPTATLNELFRHTGEDVIRHLFTVAASLDSMVVGEAQILAQVKQAYEIAAQQQSTGQYTHAAFQSAIRVAKRIANETLVHRKRVSIPSVAIGGFARQIFERLDNKSIVVIGTGEMGQETLRYLKEENAHNITIINRTREAAEQLAQQFHCHTAPWCELNAHLIQADIVVSTTGSEQPIITAERFQTIESERFQRPLFILDLAVPRDFEPAVGECLGVYLYTLDDLSQACELNRQERQNELPKAQAIIDKETRRFMLELERQSTGPTIRRLRESAELVRDSELKRLFHKLEGQVDDRHWKEIEQSFGRLVNKILHPPLESLKENIEGGEHAKLLDALKRLFRLPEE